MILIILSVISNVPWMLCHLTYPINYCNMANTCTHDYQVVCGSTPAGCRRSFLDLCDMYEYNCDYGTRYKRCMCDTVTNEIAPIKNVDSKLSNYELLNPTTKGDINLACNNHIDDIQNDKEVETTTEHQEFSKLIYHETKTTDNDYYNKHAETTWWYPNLCKSTNRCNRPATWLTTTKSFPIEHIRVTTKRPPLATPHQTRGTTLKITTQATKRDSTTPTMWTQETKEASTTTKTSTQTTESKRTPKIWHAAKETTTNTDIITEKVTPKTDIITEKVTPKTDIITEKVTPKTNIITETIKRTTELDITEYHKFSKLIYENKTAYETKFTRTSKYYTEVDSYEHTARTKSQKTRETTWWYPSVCKFNRCRRPFTWATTTRRYRRRYHSHKHY